MSMGIYKISFGTDSFYIGSSNNLEHRKGNHLYDLKNNNHCNKIMQNHFNKYKDKFTFEILELTAFEDLTLREQYYIDTLAPCINIMPIAGTRAGYKHTLETKKIMSDIVKLRMQDVEQRKKISKALSGKSLSQKRKDDMKLRLSIHNPWKGKKHSQSTKEKMSASAKTRDKSTFNLSGFQLGYKHNCKRTKLYTNNGEIMEFESISHLGRWLGYKNISRKLKKSNGDVMYKDYRIVYV